MAHSRRWSFFWLPIWIILCSYSASIINFLVCQALTLARLFSSASSRSLHPSLSSQNVYKIKLKSYWKIIRINFISDGSLRADDALNLLLFPLFFENFLNYFRGQLLYPSLIHPQNVFLRQIFGVIALNSSIFSVNTLSN